MKIESLHGVNGIIHDEEKKARQEGPGGSSFESFLVHEMAGLQTGPASRVDAALAADTPGATGVSRGNEAGGMPPFLGAFGGALDRLAQMCAQERSGPADLEAVAQALTELGQAADEVLHHTQALAGDHPVRRLAEEARVLAYVESVKWARGDYL